MSYTVHYVCLISTVSLNAKGVGELPQNTIQSEQSQSYFNFY